LAVSKWKLELTDIKAHAENELRLGFDNFRSKSFMIEDLKFQVDRFQDSDEICSKAID
jgi:hypothetical protein